MRDRRVQHGFRVLDAGAGGGLYRDIFREVTYETADFAQLDKSYAPLDYVCDLSDIPVEDERYDLVICTQVLEHIHDPAGVVGELSRVLKPGGELWMSAPLFFEEHETPYDFYRYTQFAWRRLAGDAGLQVKEIAWLEGYYGSLAYQLQMASRSLPGRSALPLRVFLLFLAHWYYRRDRRHKVVDRGMPKNYRCVFVRK